MSLHALLPTMPRVTEAAPYKLDIASEALLLSGAKPRPSGIFHPREGVSPTILSLLLDAMVLDEITLLRFLGYLGRGGGASDQLSK